MSKRRTDRTFTSLIVAGQNVCDHRDMATFIYLFIYLFFNRLSKCPLTLVLFVNLTGFKQLIHAVIAAVGSRPQVTLVG